MAVKLTEPQKTCCHSADTDFYQAVAELFVGFLPTKATNTMVMGICPCTDVGLCRLHDNKSLILR